MEEAQAPAVQQKERGPETGYDWYVLAESLMDQHRLEEALHAYEEAARLNPDHWVTQYKLGGVRQKLKLDREAIEAYSEALRLNGNAVSAYVHRAQSLRTLGDTERALQDLETALQKEPRSKRIRELLDEYRGLVR